MRKLPIYAKALLLQGSSITGNFTDGYFFSEEKIKMNQASELFEFCKWIDKNIGGAAAGNIDMLFSAFKNPKNTEMVKQANDLAALIQSFKPNR